MVANQEVIDRLNDLFGSEAFTQAETRAFVSGLVEKLLEDQLLVQQAKQNSKKQFVESPDFVDAVTMAVSDNQHAHNKIADSFFTDGPGLRGLQVSIAEAFYLHAANERVETTG